MLSVVMRSAIMVIVVTMSVIMLSIMMCVVLLSVIILSVVMLSVVAPLEECRNNHNFIDCFIVSLQTSFYVFILPNAIRTLPR